MKRIPTGAALGAALVFTLPAEAARFVGCYTAGIGTPAVANLSIETADILNSVGDFSMSLRCLNRGRGL